MKVSEEGVISSSKKGERQKVDIYFHSPNIAVRLLSTLLILKTLSRGESGVPTYYIQSYSICPSVGNPFFGGQVVCLVFNWAVNCQSVSWSVSHPLDHLASQSVG